METMLYVAGFIIGILGNIIPSLLSEDKEVASHTASSDSRLDLCPYW